MSLALGAYGGNCIGRQSVAFGTVINSLVPPRKKSLTRVSTVRVTAAGTAHTLTMLRPLGRTTASAVAAISQAVVNLTAQPQSGNNVAANDLIAIRHSADGVTRLYTVSSVSSLAITMTGNFTVAIAAGDDVWFFGVIGDTDPLIGSAHPTLPIPASATTVYQDTIGGVVASHLPDQPILLQSNNATATGAIEHVAYAYTKE